MMPRHPVAPKPPPRVLKALKSAGEAPEATGNPLLTRYLNDLARIGAWKVLVLHYVALVALGLGFWHTAQTGAGTHPEILLKLLATYCFFIGVLVVPLVSPILFPPIDEDDPSFGTLPIGPVSLVDTRMLATALVSALALLPLLPILVISSPFLGGGIDILSAMPFLQGVLSAAWVFLLMEMACPAHNPAGRMARRLAVIGAFLLLHIGLVGLMAQLSPSTLQRAAPLKILIDVNPFSQLYILIEGAQQARLIFATDFLRLVDHRLYLFILQGLVFALVLGVYRAVLNSRFRSSND